MKGTPSFLHRKYESINITAIADLEWNDAYDGKMLYILAGYNDETENYFAGIPNKLYAQGFIGKHTKDIPHHITLGSFPTEQEGELTVQLP